MSQRPPDPPTSPNRLWLIAGLLACVALGVAHALYYWPEVIDDAYITFRYARNFVSGAGLSFNPGGPPVEGFSNLAWFWISALALRLGAHDLLQFMKVVGLVLHAGTIVAVWALAGGLERSARPTTLVAPLLFATNPFVAYHAVAGLETPLHVALIATAALSILELERHPRLAFPLLLLSLALTPWSRPESFGYAGALLVAGGVLHRDRRGPRRLLLRAAAVAAISIALLAVWRWTTFGALLPNTALAKSAGPSGRETLMTGALYVARFFSALPVPADLAVYLLALAALAAAFRATDLVLLAPVACAVVFSVAVRGDWMHSFRFLVPATPFLSALIARKASLALGGPRWRSLSAGRRIATVAVAGLLAVMVFQQSLLYTVHGEGGFGRSWKSRFWPAQIGERVAGGFPARLTGITRWSIEHVSSRQVIATGDIGFPAWASDARIVDLAGLTDRELGRIIPARGAAAYRRYIESRKPDIVVMRVERGRPVMLYDELTAGSGALGGYALIDSADTYWAEARALLYRRMGSALSTAPDSVLARYDRAIAWNPRVPILETWRRQYASRANAATAARTAASR